MTDEAKTNAYRKAADQGDPDAQFNLAVSYTNGRGVPQDDIQAILWYKKAADNGHTGAQNNLGWMHDNGRGVAKDLDAAIHWYRKAADNGNAIAQNNLGGKYENGNTVKKDLVEAAKWYRLAAAQGHAQAKERLARVEGLIISLQKSKAPPPVLKRKAEPPPAVERREIKPAPVVEPREKIPEAPLSGHEQRECKPLLDACTPHVYVQNSFRITGLAVDAPPRDIKRRIDDLKQAEEMGDAEDEHCHAFALSPPPSISHIRDAAQRLQDPERRIIEEFFWFWPLEWGGGHADPALLALKNGDKDTAFKTWMAHLSADAKTGVVGRGKGLTIRDASATANIRTITVAKHNLAVMYQLVALDSEHHLLKNELEADQLQTIEKYWRACFKWWEELTDDETFWSLVTERIRLIDEPDRLKTGFARQMRATLPEAMDKINAELAISYSKKGNLSLVEQHIRYMQDTHQGKDNIKKTLAGVTQPLKLRIENCVETANRTANTQPKQAVKAAHELLLSVKEPLQIIQRILPLTDHDRVDICDSVAEACLTCQMTHSRETKDWKVALALLKEAEPYATGADTKLRFAENIATVSRNVLFDKHLAPLVQQIEQISAKRSLAEKVNAVEEYLLPAVQKIKHNRNVTKDVYAECADLVAGFLRGLSVSAYNDDSDLPMSFRILDMALFIACGQETIERLNNDKKQLAGIQAQAVKHNLRMQIRSDDIEITRDIVRYNQRTLSAQQIRGIKYGVFVQYTNGIESSSSYLIDIDGGQSGSINIECKRVFRSKAQAEQDFNAILEALFHQVIPSLVARLAEGIVAGRPLVMGAARLTAEGVFITTGMLWWQKERLVSWSDIRFGNHQGSLSLSSATDKDITTSMALRDEWNAVFFKFIADAVVELKNKR